MKHRITCITPEHRNRALAIIGTMPIDPVHEVVIREAKRDRSADQNALYWQWLTIIGSELGMTKDELHEQCKARHLVPIFTRDNEDYSAMVAAVQAVRSQGMIAEADALWSQVVRMTSTTDCSVRQMAEYLNEIEREAVGLGIRLPHPEERGR